MSESEGAPQQELRLVVPPEIITGTYANMAAVHHTEHEFTLDFIRTGLKVVDEKNNQVAHVVARVAVPTSVIFNIARAIADNVTTFEQTYGTIRSRPDFTPTHPPEEDNDDQ